MISTSTGPIFAKFSLLVELWLRMNDLKLVFPSRKGRCHGNQFCGPSPGLIHIRVRFARWRRTTRSASAALDAGEPFNGPINNNWRAARGIAGRATDRICLACGYFVRVWSTVVTIDYRAL